MNKHRAWRWTAKWASRAVFAVAISAAHAATPQERACQLVELEGQVNAGQEWSAAFGQGWVFRVLPIGPPSAGYSGWDLVVDRDPPAGYPDSLLVATLPYNSINEREIGTTFGLRAQDAVGWNPRSFRFLTNPAEFQQAKQWMGQLAGGVTNTAPGAKAENTEIARRLLRLARSASSGQLRILDARLEPGVADPKPFAHAWALAFSRTQYRIEPVAAEKASPQGKLVWMRFALTLWLPSGWKFPSGIKPVRTACPE